MRSLGELHGGSYKRATFYFPVGDEVTAAEYLDIPDHKKPGEIRDIHFKFCGQKLKRSAAFDEWLENEVPDKWKDRCSKSEKGIDIEICCDAIRLASASRLDRLFLLTNDDDFLPFCRTIKEYGANVSIIHLTDRVNGNISLLREADSYDVVPVADLQTMFLPVQAASSADVPLQEPDSEKAEPATSSEPEEVPRDNPNVDSTAVEGPSSEEKKAERAPDAG